MNFSVLQLLKSVQEVVNGFPFVANLSRLTTFLQTFFSGVMLYYTRKPRLKEVGRLKEGFKTIDEYIQTFPSDIQFVLQKMRRIIQEAAPEATETISYRMPTFKLKGNLVHFAAFKDHIGFYPTPSGIEAFKKEISQYKWAKGSIQFPLNKPVPFDLVKRIIVFRVQEVSQKNASNRLG